MTEPEPELPPSPVGIVLYRPSISRLPRPLQDAERRLLLARIPHIRDYDEMEQIAHKIRTPPPITAIDPDEDAYAQSLMSGYKRMDLERPTQQAKQRLALVRAYQERDIPLQLFRRFAQLQRQPASLWVKKSFERDKEFYYA